MGLGDRGSIPLLVAPVGLSLDMPTKQLVFISMRDGVRLAASLYVPDGDGPWPAVLEALPYRKDDVTS